MVNKLEEDILLLVGQGEMNTTQITKSTGKTKGTIRSALKRLVNKNKLFESKRFAKKAYESWFTTKPEKQKVVTNYNLTLTKKWEL